MQNASIFNIITLNIVHVSFCTYISTYFLEENVNVYKTHGHYPSATCLILFLLNLCTERMEEERIEDGGSAPIMPLLRRKIAIWLVFLPSLQAELKSMRLYFKMIFASSPSFSPTKIKHIATAMTLYQISSASGGSWKSTLVPCNGWCTSSVLRKILRSMGFVRSLQKKVLRTLYS